MEALYRKKENGRYEHVGYNCNNIPEGIWLITKNLYSKSTSGLIYRIGDVPYADVRIHALMTSFEDELSSYLLNLITEGSRESKEAREILGGWLKEGIKLYNISPKNMIQLILRKLAILVEERSKKDKDGKT
jgi:hypothetical protein